MAQGAIRRILLGRVVGVRRLVVIVGMAARTGVRRVVVVPVVTIGAINRSVRPV